MRDQYAGDVTDAVKFSLLRRLAGHDRRLGVAWYYDPGHDGSTDGGHVAWREDEGWLEVDAVVHRELSRVPERSVAGLEAAPIWPEATVFHRTPVAARGDARSGWARGMRDALDAADLVFLDPDNGIAVDASVKHATFTEARKLRRADRALVVIRFPNRSAPHVDQIARDQALFAEESDAETVVTLRIRVGLPGASRTVWFHLLDADEEIRSRAEDFAADIRRLPRSDAELIGRQSPRRMARIFSSRAERSRSKPKPLGS